MTFSAFVATARSAALYSTQDKADYVHDIYAQDEGAGYTDSVSVGVDSRTALQLDAKFTDRFSAVIQVVSEAVYNNSWDNEPNEMWIPSLEWANLSYRVTDNFTVRGGRIVMPFLMGAEYQKVGYANHFDAHADRSVRQGSLHQPRRRRSCRSSTRSVRERTRCAATTVRRKAIAKLPLPSFDADMFGFIDTFEIGALTLRASYADFEDPGAIPKNDEGQLAMIAQHVREHRTVAAAAAAAANVLANAQTPGYKDKVKYYAVGASYDVGNWFAMGEVFEATGESNLSAEHTSGLHQRRRPVEQVDAVRHVRHD